MKKYFIKTLILGMLLICGNTGAQNYTLVSPDGKLQVEINTIDQVSFRVKKGSEELIPHVDLGLEIEEIGVLGVNSEIKDVEETTENGIIRPVVPIKNEVIKDEYNQLKLVFKDGWDLVFRVYDDAVVYKFVTHQSQEITVLDETVDILFPEEASAWFSLLEGADDVEHRWMTSYEKVYQKKDIKELNTDRVELPFLADLGDLGKVLVTEAHLYDYPGLYFTGDEEGGLKGIHPPRVKSSHQNKKGDAGWDRTLRPKEIYSDIAKTDGKRDFPWRVFAFVQEDKELLNNEIVFKLAESNRLENTDWIKPGLVTWDWWNDWNISGVDFEVGINNDTYKYYIDFAAENDIPYIIMDDGWYELGDLTKESKGIDVQELVDYAADKNVGIILWASWLTMNKNMAKVLDIFEKWGVKGIKVDFMDRDDQEVVNFYWKMAEEAAKRHLIVDFHGSHKPTGLNRTFPNVVNYEGVAGLEQTKWSDDIATPDMAVSIPFIRMFTGPMDYTPGAMINAQQKYFKSVHEAPMSLGTRVQQVAMYILYEAPLQMLSDNPDNYRDNEEILNFLKKMPTTWDQTFAMDGKVGEYVVMARQKRSDYYVGAMTNSEPREMTIDFSFLPEGDWRIEILQDGENAEENAEDYKRIEQEVNNETKLNIHLATGGGWAGHIFKE